MTDKDIEELMDSLAELPVEDQVWKVRNTIQRLSVWELHLLFDNKRFNEWSVANKDTINMMAERGDFREQ